ncbi:MAG TPA: chemotaxis protein CheA [Ignavibacteriales bacterium]|nr:chemotaxis protein CheA [Ignavibacteriales bacterium]HOL80711.1 chemotaxis protein CheA [Ignavibacteriales bacterium]HPP32956.1 chemotaxis protein CheA [Ignavibacteriales bacterium]
MSNYALLNDPEMKEIFESFVVETREILEKLDLELVELEKRTDDTNLLNQIFRSFHTVKGTAGFLGLVKMQAVTHRLEDILNKLRKGEVKLNSEIMDGILQGFDTMKILMDTIENNKNEDVETEGVIQTLESLLKAMESGDFSAVSSQAAPEVAQVEQAQEQAPVEEKVETVAEETIKDEEQADEVQEEETEEVNDEAEEIKEEEVKAEAVKTEEPKEEKKEQKQPEQAVAKVQQPVAQPKVEQPKATQPAAQPAKQIDNSIRVDVERLDQLLNIVSELVLGRNRLAQVNTEMQVEHEGTKLAKDLFEAYRQIDLMTTELQLAVMKTRMIKIGKVFNKYPRVVRDLCRETKKDIQLLIYGEDTELDKTLIEEINDPLVHLIRNAVDHGIETPQERVAKGKNPQGTVILAAEHEGNNINITIQDDGKGMDPEVIKRKAIEKGLITKEKANDLNKNEIFNLIFLPGFSTAEKITSISGRGVGMDVVKTNVTKLRGTIQIDSEVGKGTKIVIKLPLTLAIIQGLLVRVKTETVVIPLSSVIEVVRVAPEEIYTINQNEVIRIRNSVLSLLRVEDILYDDLPEDDNDKKWQYVVIISAGDRKYGIRVDELIGQKEIVIKSLGSYLGNIEGLAGATIMGDGKVVMILDIGDLVNKIVTK